MSESQSWAALERGDEENDQPAVNIFIPQRAIDVLAGDIVAGEPDAEIA